MLLLLDKTHSTSMVYVFSWSADRKKPTLPQVIGITQYERIQFIAQDEKAASELEFPSPFEDEQTQPQQESDSQSQ